MGKKDEESHSLLLLAEDMEQLCIAPTWASYSGRCSPGNKSHSLLQEKKAKGQADLKMSGKLKGPGLLGFWKYVFTFHPLRLVLVPLQGLRALQLLLLSDIASSSLSRYDDGKWSPAVVRWKGALSSELSCSDPGAGLHLFPRVKLGMQSILIATACTIYHKFFCKINLDTCDPYLVAMLSIYLAGKLEKSPSSIHTRYLCVGCWELSSGSNQVFLWALLSDSYHGGLCLWLQNQNLAMAVLYLALQVFGVEVPVEPEAKKSWWQMLFVLIHICVIDERDVVGVVIDQKLGRCHEVMDAALGFRFLKAFIKHQNRSHVEQQLTCVWIRLRPRNQRIWPLRSSRSAWAMNRSNQNESIGEKVDEADTHLSPDQLPNTNK
ncbi:hypothetical protein A6R68_19168 [Neotoma lepida]|uniref:Cyclin N-terminal domain-containing protein n=1 Tax=Neotoma lepida TaxID=56216 RepID=A0A1A6HJQ9_NEOLE|nr:hypothetical protein A6R68_19168 [Neotoma lepida]